MSSDVIAGLGSRTSHIARVPNLDPDELVLNAEEKAVFDALVRRAMPIAEVISRSALGDGRAVAALLSLRARGIIVPAKVTTRFEPVMADATLNEEVDLDEPRRREILELEGKLTTANDFELLGLPVLASPDEVKKAFYELSRKFHPDRYFGKSLGSYRHRLEKVFRRLSEAHQTLSDPTRRTAYLQNNPQLSSTVDFDDALSDLGPPPPPGPRVRTPEDDRRDEERRKRLARHPYLAKGAKVNELLLRAKAHMAKSEFAHAFTQLNLAAQMDDRNVEVKTLLVEVRKKNDEQRAETEYQKGVRCEEMGDHNGALAAFKAAANIYSGHAAANYGAAKLLGGDPKESSAFAQRAVDASPSTIKYRILYAEILERGGMKAMSRRQWEEIVKLDPEHAEAKKQLKRKWPF